MSYSSNPANYYPPAAPVVSDDGQRFWFPDNPSLVFDATAGLPGQDVHIWQAGRWWYNGGDQASLPAGQYGIIHLTGWSVGIPDLPMPLAGSVSGFMMSGPFTDILNALWSLRGGTLLGVVVYEYRRPIGGLAGVVTPNALSYEFALITQVEASAAATPPVMQAQWFAPAGQPQTAAGAGATSLGIAGLDIGAFLGGIWAVLALGPEGLGVGAAVAAGVIALLAVDGVTGGHFIAMLKGLYSSFIGGLGTLATTPITAGTKSVLVIAGAGVALALALGLAERRGATFDVGGASALLGAGGGLAQQGVRSSEGIVRAELGAAQAAAGGALGAGRAAAAGRAAVSVEQARAETARVRGQSAVQVARLRAAQAQARRP